MKLKYILIAFFIYTIAVCTLWGKIYHASGNAITNIAFGYGVLITQLEQTSIYKVCNVHYENICFTTHRLPLITYFLFGIKKLGGDVLTASFVKTIFSYLLISLSLLMVFRNRKITIFTLLPILLVFSIPKWILNYAEVGLEEPYIIPFISFLVAVYLFNDEEPEWKYVILIAVSLVSCMWLKHSMLYFPFVYCLLYGIKYRNIKKTSILVSVCLLSAIAIALFSFQVSGRLTLSSSWEGWNLYKGNNEYTLKYYPEYNLDNLDNLGLMKADKVLSDEWEYNTYFKEKAVKYIKANPIEFVKGIFVKAYVYFLDFGDSGRSLGERPYENKMEIANSIVLFVFRFYFVICLFTSFYLALIAKFSTKVMRLNIYFFWLMITSIGGFHMIGFAYQRHFMPLVLPVAFYGIYFVSEIYAAYKLKRFNA